MEFLSKKKHAVVILTVIAMLFSLVVPLSGNVVLAEEPALTVYYEDTVKKAYDLDDLTEAAINVEGNKKYTYSTYNSYPTYEIKKNVPGVTVEYLISEAGITLSAIDDNHIIVFETGDSSGRTAELTWKQLTEERYCYPNGTIGTADGLGGDESARAGKYPVIPIVSLDSDYRLMIGQKIPNEQTKEIWNKYIADGGKIRVTTKTATKLSDVSIVQQDNILPWETEVELLHDQFKPANKSIVIYYTTNGKSPITNPADVYNYGTSGRTVSREVKVHESLDPFTVKTYATKYGYLDSNETSKTYSSIPNSVAGLKAKTTYNKVTLSWTKKAGVDGYNVYYSTSKNGKYKKLGTKKQAKSSYVHSKLKTGKTYYYKVEAYKGSTKGEMSKVITAKPSLKKPKSVKAKAKGSKKIVITAKKVTGQSGYKIFRSTKKNKGFKAIKTVKTTKKLNFTDTKVKSGKKYYYKVKAYRVVKGKKVYSPYSSVASKKAK